MGWHLLAILVSLVVFILMCLYIGHIGKENEEREEEKMAKNVVFEVDAPEGVVFQGYKIVSLRIANNGDADGYYVMAMEYDKSCLKEMCDEPLDAAIAETFVNPWLLRGRDF